MKNNPLVTVLLVILALVAADLFLNDGRALASIASGAGDAATAVEGQNLNNAAIQSQPQQPQQVIVQPVTATPGPGDVIFTVIDDGNEPVIRDLVPTAVRSEPTQTPDTTQRQPLSTPTAISPYEPPVGGYTVQFLEDCAAALQGNRRASPRCPANSAEMLAAGGR